MGRRTSFALGCSHSTTLSHHSFGYASILPREGGRDGCPFSSNGRLIGILFSFSQFVASIILRESQISFALQMLFSSGNPLNSRFLNSGNLNSVLLSSSDPVAPIISSNFAHSTTLIPFRFARFGNKTRGNKFFIFLHPRQRNSRRLENMTL